MKPTRLALLLAVVALGTACSEDIEPTAGPAAELAPAPTAGVAADTVAPDPDVPRPGAAVNPGDGPLTVEEHQFLVESYNRSGCDGAAGPLTCTNAGACCDAHDACIDEACPSPYGDLLQCTPAAAASGACPPACVACHREVRRCTGACLLDGNAAGCGPADCCGPPNTCGREQACYDRTQNPPELITDPCECQARGIDLSPSPPRPEAVCCAATGWGCCAGVGQAPGAGGGGCCAPLWEEDGVCTFRCMGGPPLLLRDADAIAAAAVAEAYCEPVPTTVAPTPAPTPTPVTDTAPM